MSKILTCLILTFSVTTGIALGEDTTPKPVKKKPAATKKAKLTAAEKAAKKIAAEQKQAEAAAKRKAAQEELFKAKDVNSDSKLSFEEFKTTPKKPKVVKKPLTDVEKAARKKAAEEKKAAAQKKAAERKATGAKPPVKKAKPKKTPLTAAEKEAKKKADAAKREATLQKAFQAKDANTDGSLTLVEFSAKPKPVKKPKK